MMFKNSTKLLAANFSTVWKLILYYIIVIGITVGLIAPFFGVIGTEFNAGGALNDFGTLLTRFNVSVDLFGFLVDLNTTLTALLSIFFNLFVTNTWVVIYLSFVVFYLFPFLLGLADLAVGQNLFGYMSSLTKYSFVGSYAKMFKRSVRFQLFKNLVFLPVNLGIAAAAIYTLRLTTLGGILIYFTPFIVFAVIAILVALKRSFFAGWMPAIVVYDCNMFVAFKKGMKAVMRRFLKVFSTALMIMIITIALNYLLGTFTFPIIIPLAIAFFYIFEMVMFYGSQGMRYYVDLDTILSPKRLEENDSFSKLKEII